MNDPEHTNRLVKEFLDVEVYAVVGASENTEKYGYKVFKELSDGGYRVYAVNPRCADIFGEKCYPDLASLPETPHVVEFVCPPGVTTETVRSFPELDIDKAWMQPGAESEEAIRFCDENGIKVLFNTCLLLERRKN